MRDKSYFTGLALALIAFITAHFHHYDSALFGSLCAIGCWLNGVCHAIKGDFEK